MVQPDPTSPLDLDALKALGDAATPGPWYRAKNHSRSRVDDPDNAIGAFAGPHTRYLAVVGDGGCHGDTDAKSDADAEFIAAARDAVPALLAALAEAQRRERESREHALSCNAEATKLAEAQLTVIDQRDAARADAERTRRELTDAGWSSVADLHAAYVDVLGRWQRSEPIVEAARAWYAACDPGAISAPDVRAASHALGAALDTYETQTGGTE